MKNIIILFLLTCLLSTTKGFGQIKTIDTVYIHTSSVCDMCKERIETALAYEKGVKSSDLDVKTKIVKVIYRPTKTTPLAIRKAISAIGYNADEVVADVKAYNKLSKCCKHEGSM